MRRLRLPRPIPRRAAAIGLSVAAALALSATLSLTLSLLPAAAQSHATPGQFSYHADSDPPYQIQYAWYNISCAGTRAIWIWTEHTYDVSGALTQANALRHVRVTGSSGTVTLRFTEAQAIEGIRITMFCGASETAYSRFYQRYIPGPVRGLVATAISKQSVSLSWNTHNDASNCDVCLYDVRYRALIPTGAAWRFAANGQSNNAVTAQNLAAGTPYEFQVKNRSAGRDRGWSPSLYIETVADTFSDDPPDNLAVNELALEPDNVSLELTWDKIADAQSYQLERIIGDRRDYYAPNGPNTRWVNSYAKTADGSGVLIYRVRAVKQESNVNKYSPWSPSVRYQFYRADGEAIADPKLEAALQGSRAASRSDVQDVRNSFETALDAMLGPTNAQYDADAVTDWLTTIPGLAMLMVSAYSGWRFGMPALGAGIGYLLLMLSLFTAAAVTGFPIIWPMIMLLFAVLFGVVSIARTNGWM